MQSVAAQVCDLARTANIPPSVVAEYLLGITPRTLERWASSTTTVPKDRIPQLTEIRNTLQHYVEAGILPRPKNELIWLGVIHLTECMQSDKK